jgi:putative transposase
MNAVGRYAIESLSFHLRKSVKNQGHFPNDTVAVRLLRLAICNSEVVHATERENERRN